jgi:hypothetical protein
MRIQHAFLFFKTISRALWRAARRIKKKQGRIDARVKNAEGDAFLRGLPRFLPIFKQMYKKIRCGLSSGSSYIMPFC